MVKKTYIIDPEKCTGCRMCEIVCSASHFGESNPSLAGIHIFKWEAQGYYLPVRCQHCVDAPCMAICPKGAIFRDANLDSVKIDYDLCIGCKMCVSACPFGAMGYSEEYNKIFKCDLCDGDPQCVSFCDAKAVDYLASQKVQFAKMRKSAHVCLEQLSKQA